MTLRPVVGKKLLHSGATRMCYINTDMGRMNLQFICHDLGFTVLVD